MDKAAFIVEMDQQELAVRLIEASAQIKRPLGASAAETLAKTDADIREDFLRAAVAAMRYLEECFNAGRKPS